VSASPKTVVDAGTRAIALASLQTAPAATSSGEALQALLAFSALHEQIRQRRMHEKHNGAAAGPPDAWRLEHFVLDEVLQLVAQRALGITGADGVAIALAESDAIVCRAVAGKVTPDPGVRLDPNSGFSGACLSSGQVVRCDDSETDPRVNAESCRALVARSMVAVPLSAKQTNIGLVEAFSSEPYGFNDSDVRSLSLLAELILAALQPEEEDRLAEISQRVVKPTAADNPESQLESHHAKEDQAAPDAGESHAEQTQIALAKVEPIEPAQSEPEPAKPKALELEQAQLTPHAASMPAEVAEPEPAPAVAFTDYGEAKSSRPGLAVVVALVIVAGALGAAMWWNLHQHPASVVLAPQNAALMHTNSVPPAETSTATTPAAQAAEKTAEPEPDESAREASATIAAGERPEVTGIRHWSSADSSTVVIDLEDQVQYEAHRLSHPERIYVDLPDTRLTASLFNKTIDVGDALLQRVRIAQPTHGVTRVVLETKGASNFSVSLEPNPYRLVIEVRTIGSEPKPRAKVDLFGPVEQSQPSLLAKNAENQAPASTPHASEPKLRIVLDAGHGGWDLGTVGRKGLLEKDLVLDIVERLGKLVEKRLGAAVIYTRADDNYIALEKRAEIANLAKANLFLSIHANYSDFPSARGVETYYTNTYSSVRARSRDSEDAGATSDVDWTNVDIREKVHESRRLAASIQRSLYGTLSAKNPGLPNRGVKRAQYVVLTGTSMPAVLAEVSFVSSPTDENNLQSSSYRQRIAEALYQGLARYTEQGRVKIASAENLAGQ
jgi:N-acetylmuramoyl-L-alanine amidase/putative methionine-R-sulfoxide reductase with GAF domain